MIFGIARRQLGLALALIVLAGCGGERTYHLNGMVTYNGKPVPEGYIVFEPDGSQGNSGAPASCKILDGKYDTRNDQGRGVVGGPHTIQIRGMASKIGGDQEGGTGEVSVPKPLFKPYSFSEDLALEDATFDIEVPSRP